MHHVIQQRIGTLRLRVRRLLLLHGFSLVVATALAAIIVLGLGDYWIRFQDRGLRVLCWLGLLAAVGWTCYRGLLLPLAAAAWRRRTGAATRAAFSRPGRPSVERG